MAEAVATPDWQKVDRPATTLSEELAAGTIDLKRKSMASIRNDTLTSSPKPKKRPWFNFVDTRWYSARYTRRAID